LNPDRVSPPDIDIIFASAPRRSSLNTSGKSTVTPCRAIITFGKLKAKRRARRGRVMGWSYRDADRHRKMIPNELNITLDTASKDPTQERVAAEPPTRELFECESSRRVVAQRRRARRGVVSPIAFIRLIRFCRDGPRQRCDQPVCDGTSQRSRFAGKWISLGLKTADRDRRHANAYSQTRPELFTEEYSTR